MRVAVIGCGKQGRRHLAALAGLSEVTGLVAADVDDVLSRSTAERPNAEIMSVDAVFADSGIDAIVIAAATGAHGALARRAIEAGKHFLCEKPFGADVAVATAAARDAAAMGVIGRVGYLYRFAPAIAAARASLDEIGKIETARFGIAGLGSHAPWKHRRETRGGAVNELASHMIDLALWFFGPMRDCVVLEKAQSLQRRDIGGDVADVDAEDRIVARLRSMSGVAITIEADFAAPRFSQSLEIVGARGLRRGSIEGAPDLCRLQARSFLAAISGARGEACSLAEAAQVCELLEFLHAT